MINLHLLPFSGISGDMFLGLLLDLGFSLSTLEKMLQDLKLNDVSLKQEKVKYHGITGTKVHVITKEQSSHRHLPQIESIITNSALPERVQVRAKTCFRHLAEAEAKVHGTTPEKIHFHEVGALDAIVDICGVILGLESLEINEVTSQEVSLGTGFVLCAHGKMPVPVPAVCELLQGIPIRQTAIPFELTTPTGAALLKTVTTSFTTQNFQSFEKVGYGAGGRQLEEAPNLLRGYLSKSQKKNSSDVVILLETNLDDCSPEMVGYVVEQLLQNGALDVFATPIFMKKNRPGILLSCLVPLGEENRFEQIIFKETPTFGIRKQMLQREILSRCFEEVETEFGKVRVKIGAQDDQKITISPEYEDCKQLAVKSKKPLREIMAAVIYAYGSKKKQ